jgi:hypothetical protein
MAAPFSVENTTPGTQVWAVDAVGNTTQSGNMAVSGTAAIAVATIPTQSIGSLTTTGVITQNSGINSSGSVNVLVGTQTGLGGTTVITTLGTGGTQIFDTTRDYMLYIETTTTGGATILLGPTATATLATVFVGSLLTAGTSGVISFRVPAGWYTRFTGTTWACANPVAISC